MADRTHRDLCHQASQWLLSQRPIKMVCWELRFSGGIVDAIGVDPKNKKIIACEVKRTRSDLLADLRALKLLKYERSSTHCYLAATPEALGKTPLEDLITRGLPAHWGILVLGDTVTCLRPARAHRSVREVSINKLVLQIGRAHLYRHMDLLGLT